MKGVRRVVGELIVAIIIKDGSSTTEWQNTAIVRKRVKRVVITFIDGEWTMDNKPMDEVGYLTDSTANTRSCFTKG
ncbi:hypothetical protein D3C81_2000610 [compost metagenome]